MHILVAEFDKYGRHMAGNKTILIEYDRYGKIELPFVKTDDGYVCNLTEEQMNSIIHKEWTSV